MATESEPPRVSSPNRFLPLSRAKPPSLPCGYLVLAQACLRDDCRPHPACSVCLFLRTFPSPSSFSQPNGGLMQTGQQVPAPGVTLAGACLIRRHWNIPPWPPRLFTVTEGSFWFLFLPLTAAHARPGLLRPGLSRGALRREPSQASALRYAQTVSPSGLRAHFPELRRRLWRTQRWDAPAEALGARTRCSRKHAAHTPPRSCASRPRPPTSARAQAQTG